MNESILKTISVSDKGQITIPREIQKKLGIKKGDSLVIASIKEKILILQGADLLKSVEDDFSDITKFSESLLDKTWSNKGDYVWKKYLE